jgi:hypothetical protein
MALIYYALTDAVQIWRIAAYASLATYKPEIPVPLPPVQPLPTAPRYPAEPLPPPSSPEPESSL